MRRIQRTFSIVVVTGAIVAGGATIASAGTAPALGGVLLGVSCPSVTSCMAVGSAGGPNGNAALLADRWNGVAWSVVPVPKPAHMQGGDLASVSCTSPSACMAVGSYGTGRISAPLAERWNGMAWAVLSAPRAAGTAPDLFGVSCATTSSCAAVGCLLNGDFCAGTVAYEWNGTAWQAEPTPAGGQRLGSVSCTAPSSCMAVGEGGKGTLVEHWNGRAWAVVPSPDPRSRGFLQFDGVSCRAAACEAVGSYANNRGAVVTLAERWNGHAWSIQQSPNPPGALVGLYSVSCSAVSACTATGNYDNGKGQTITTALRWDGTAWALQAPANPATSALVDTLSAVSCAAAARCNAVGGNVFGSTGHSRALAEGWNGTGWSIEPTPAGP
jgi:hypothetical protein